MSKENFETSLMNLEKIVAELESGKLSLEDSLERYKQGIDLIKNCKRINWECRKRSSEIN